MNKQYLAETQREIAAWPGVTITQEDGGKHGRVVLHHNGESRFVVVSNTPSDALGIKNHIALVRRILKGMGASKAVPPLSPAPRERNKPVRIAVPAQPTPVRDNPFLNIESIAMNNNSTNAIDAIFSGIEKLRYAEMLEFAAILSVIAMGEKMRRSNTQDWARTLHAAALANRETSA